ncbi:M48 family metallopeptidase [Aurantiacibacter gangjinensis]|uniref:Metal-dependent hydrolase n=1 Tax=Aurantiacibacter gangjinensis TaxID=502682 RepID=A0A0G9MMA6_9SPHN|nr:SprT family zinc-dependent metalloprotease [Aurantiacibacter gangjinensis]APE27907.1 putative metal-dependent hydrolase [Aurantiacibacter gangjinensis]KLE31866.1 metal-dependent hydrolase [Aurantiacibacter gangjinensis]
MIDWLRDDHQNPAVEVDGRNLPIAIRRHARAKRLTMRLAPDGSELRITLPTWGRTRDALAFAQARTDWIARQVTKVPERLALTDGSTIPFLGTSLRIVWNKALGRTPQLADSVLTVGGPRDRLQARVQRWLEGEALRLAGEDLAFYCERAGLPAPQLRLSRAQRRWGSCSGNNRTGRCIRINWRLVMAPDHVRRSVVAHEVAHLVHFDHSPAFHRLLGDLFEGVIGEADGWLKREGRGLYAAFG